MTTELRGVTWSHRRGTQPLVEAARLLSQEDSDVTVSVERYRWDTFREAAYREATSDASRFDLVVLDHPWIPDLAARGDLRPFDESALDLSDVEENCTKSYRWEGQLFALPFDAAAYATAFRTDLLGMVVLPDTWDEVLEVAAEFHDPPERFGFCVPWGNSTLFLLSLIATADGSVLVDSPELDTDVVVEALGLMRRIYQMSIPQEHVTGKRPFEVLQSSDAAAFATGVFAYVPYLTTELGNLQWGPMPKWSTGRSNSLLGGAGIAVVSSARHADVAVEFAELLMSPDFQANVSRPNGGQPARRSAWAHHDAHPSEAEFGSRLESMLADAYVRPLRPGWMVFEEGGHAILNRYLNGPNDELETLEALRSLAQASFVEH